MCLVESCWLKVGLNGLDEDLKHVPLPSQTLRFKIRLTTASVSCLCIGQRSYVFVLFHIHLGPLWDLSFLIALG